MLDAMVSQYIAIVTHGDIVPDEVQRLIIQYLHRRPKAAVGSEYWEFPKELCDQVGVEVAVHMYESETEGYVRATHEGAEQTYSYCLEGFGVVIWPW